MLGEPPSLRYAMDWQASPLLGKAGGYEIGIVYKFVGVRGILRGSMRRVKRIIYNFQ